MENLTGIYCALPENQTLEDFVRDADPGIPENQTEIKA